MKSARKWKYGPLREGQVLPIQHVSAQEVRDFGFTTTTWGTQAALIGILTVWDELDMEGFEPRIRLMSRLRNDTAGETTYHRLYNTSDDEVVTGTEISRTGTGTGIRDSGWQSYTPPTTSAPIFIQSEIRVTGGTGTILEPVCWIGLLVL